MATEAITLDKDAFMRLVTQEHLQVEGPSAGYLYTGKQGKNGWELYKTANNPWYLWQAAHVVTQDNVAGGILRLTVTIPSGVYAELVLMQAVGSASAGATLNVYIYDEDGLSFADVASVAAGVSRRISLPQVGTTPTTHASAINSTGVVIPPGAYLYIQSSTAAQTETLALRIALLLNNKTAPVVSAALSTGTPNLAASTISEANTWQLVAMP